MLRVTSWLIVLCSASVSYAAVEISLRSVSITPAAIAEQPVLQGAQCFDLYFETSQPINRTVNTGIFVTVPAGVSIFQHPRGSIQSPEPEDIAAFPGLEFDTYLAALPGGAISLGPAFFGPGGTVPMFNTFQLNRIWTTGFDAPTDVDGPIARITTIGGAPKGFGTCISFPLGTLEQDDFVVPEPIGQVLLLVSMMLGRRGFSSWR